MTTGYLVVYEANGTNYATVDVDSKPKLRVGTELFTVSVDGEMHELNSKLKEKARKEARRRKISNVVNLD